MASKREREPGKWELRVYDPSARTKQRSRTFYGSEREAGKALARFQTEVEDARKAAPVAGSFASLLERWLVHCQPDVERSTFNSYQRIAARLSADLGAMQVSEITAKRLDAYYRQLLAENIGTKDKPEHRSASTVAHYHAVARRALSEAVRWGEIPFNPAKSAKPPRVPKPQTTVPSSHDAAELVRGMVAKNLDLATFLYVLLSTGLRRGEGIALRWHHIDFEGKTMLVHRSIVVVNGELVEKDTKTHQERTVDLDDATVSALAGHRRAMRERADRCGVKLSPRAFVFSDDPRCAKSWHPDTVTKRWHRYTTAAGHPGVRVHDLRHAMATAWLDAGVPVHVVSQRLGHAKVSTTTDIYAHVSDGSQARAAEMMADKLPAIERR